MNALSAEMAKILAVAASQVGVREDPPGSNRGERVDKYRPRWKRDELARLDAEAGHAVKGDPWCTWSCTWIWHQALGRHPLGHQVGGVFAAAKKARELGMWLDLYAHKSDPADLPRAYPGCAFVLLDEPLEAGRSDGHMGIVTGLGDDGVTISTAEGNSGDRFRAGQRRLDDPRMRGIILALGLAPLTADWPRKLVSGDDLAKLGTR